jgi:hypothetical protein
VQDIFLNRFNDDLSSISSFPGLFCLPCLLLSTGEMAYLSQKLGFSDLSRQKNFFRQSPYTYSCVRYTTLFFLFFFFRGTCLLFKEKVEKTLKISHFCGRQNGKIFVYFLSTDVYRRMDQCTSFWVVSF